MACSKLLSCSFLCIFSLWLVRCVCIHAWNICDLMLVVIVCIDVILVWVHLLFWLLLFCSQLLVHYSHCFSLHASKTDVYTLAYSIFHIALVQFSVASSYIEIWFLWLFMALQSSLFSCLCLMGLYSLVPCVWALWFFGLVTCQVSLSSCSTKCVTMCIYTYVCVYVCCELLEFNLFTTVLKQTLVICMVWKRLWGRIV